MAAASPVEVVLQRVGARAGRGRTHEGAVGAHVRQVAGAAKGLRLPLEGSRNPGALEALTSVPERPATVPVKGTSALRWKVPSAWNTKVTMSVSVPVCTRVDERLALRDDRIQRPPRGRPGEAHAPAIPVLRLRVSVL
jgi:hypothetical protein